METEGACSTDGQPDVCALNMGQIHLQAGDLVGAYRYFQPLAQAGDLQATQTLVEICERAGDQARADQWRKRMPATSSREVEQ